MTKRPIEWHEECLKNMRANYARSEQTLERWKEDLMRKEAAILVLSQQIEEAKRRGKDGFDADKFMKSRPLAAVGGNKEE